VKEFIHAVSYSRHDKEQSGLYGHQAETLDSLVLSFLPSPKHDHIDLEVDEPFDEVPLSVYVFHKVLKFLKGFYIPEVSCFFT
jgi:hypothetical protein